MGCTPIGNKTIDACIRRFDGRIMPSLVVANSAPPAKTTPAAESARYSPTYHQNGNETM